jgi:hypothetical protein
MIAPKDIGSDCTPSSASDSGASTEETTDVKVGMPGMVILAADDHSKHLSIAIQTSLSVVPAKRWNILMGDDISIITQVRAAQVQAASRHFPSVHVCRPVQWEQQLGF